MHSPIIEAIRTIGFHPLKQAHSFVYGKFTRQYIWTLHRIAPHLSPAMKNHIVNLYHSKVITEEHARRIVSLNKDLDLVLPEKVLPYKHARNLILRNPESIVAHECVCRSLKKNPCKPSDVCLIVGEPFAQLAISLHRGKTRRITPEEAVSIIREEDERGHLHTAYFHTAMFDRFYAICNCCKCCCSAMKAHLGHNMGNIAPSGYVAEVSDRCDGCGECVAFCQFEAIEIGGKADISYEKCFGCGVCLSKCPRNAISLKRDPQKGEPLDIQSLAESCA